MDLSFTTAAGFASAVILRSETRRTHEHILLSQIRDSPNFLSVKLGQKIKSRKKSLTVELCAKLKVTTVQIILQIINSSLSLVFTVNWS
jgi:hypothetical protein